LESNVNAVDEEIGSLEGWLLNTGDVELVEEPSAQSAPVSWSSVPSLHTKPHWTTNPLWVIGGLLAAFIVGGCVVMILVRSMMPVQTVVQTAPPAIVYAAPAVVSAPRPTVTPLPQPSEIPTDPPVVAPAPRPVHATAPAPKKHAAVHAKRPAAKPHAAARPAPARPAAPKKTGGNSSWVDPFAS
jgi:hypothetical protein